MFLKGEIAATRLRGYAAPWLSGYVGTRLSGYAGTSRLSGYAGTSIKERVTFMCSVLVSAQGLLFRYID